LRGYLELSVSPNVLEVRPDEHLGHIPVPQLEGLWHGVWIVLEMQLQVWANEEKI